MKRIFLILALVAPSISFSDSKAVLDSVENAIRSDSTIGTYNLQLKYFQGLVFLDGEVGSEMAKTKAGELASSVKGVEDIRNELKVNPSLRGNEVTPRAMPRYADDSSLTSTLRRTLSQEGALVGDATVDVSNGVATFRGTANNFKEIDRMLSIALMVDGIRSVKNEMTINGHNY